VPRLTALLLATLGVAFAIPGTATAATPVEEAVAGLRADHVYLSPQATTRLDAARVRAAIGDAPVRIAILPAGAGVSQVRQWPRMIADQLPGNTVAVIAGRYFYAGSDLLASGAAGLAASHAIGKHKDVLRENTSSDITAALLDFVAEVKAAPLAPVDGSRDARGGRYTDEPGGGAGATEDTSILPWIGAGLLLALLAAASGVLFVRRGAAGRSRQRAAQTRALLDRLGRELDPAVPGAPTLAGAAPLDLAGLAGTPAGAGRNDAGPGGVAAGLGGAAATPAPPEWAGSQAGRAYADAAARYGTARAMLGAASTDRQVDEARHVVIEGLTAARAARLMLRRDPGPAVPDFDPPAHRTRTGSPAPTLEAGLSPESDYSPDTPYFHPGGLGAEPGWYATRIPETGAFPAPESMPELPTGVAHGDR
jgi:hypothetical protein